MIKIIRKNEKKIMAVFAVGLMVMFIKGLVPDTGQSGPTAGTAGTLAGTKISQTVINNYAKEWQFVRGLYYVEPDRPSEESLSLVAVVLTPELATRINASSNSSQGGPLYYLLIQEAIREGIVVPKEDLESFLATHISSLPAVGTDARENVELAVEHCLMIQRMLNRAGNVIKITRPQQQLALAQTAQELAIKFVPVQATSFLSQVPAPTQADIQKQFDQYSDRIAAQNGQFGEKSDPLGFGYKVPNRVMVQYIGLNRSDVHDAAIASKSKEDWYVAAYGEFKANRDDYDSRPLTASTQPSARTGAGNQPTTRKVENLDDDFALHADLVLDDLYTRETKTLTITILRQINEEMSYGFGSYRDALSAGGAAAKGAKLPAGAAADYITFKFMQDLGASIRTQYGITPILGDIEQFKTEDQLSQIPGIGHSVCPVTGNNQPIPFPLYAVGLFQPMMSDATKQSSFEAMALAAWQPSNPLEDEQTQNVYVYRNSGSDLAHTPPLAEVKDQVASDWKTNAAYQKALEASQKLLASAQKQGLDAAAAEAHLSSPITTDPFDASAIITSRAPATIPPLNLSPNSAMHLADDSLQLLTTTPGSNGRPQLLAELYADRIASVIELHEATPLWDSQTKSLYTMEIMAQLRQAHRNPLTAQLSTLQAVSDRLGYQPEKNPTTAESP